MQQRRDKSSILLHHSVGGVLSHLEVMHLSRVRATHSALALAILTLSFTGCLIVEAPVVPRNWPSATTPGEEECPHLVGTFAVSGRESGMIRFFWFVPIWWFSNAQSIVRLDEDLGLYFIDRWPTEIAGAGVIRLEQRDPEHLGIWVLRDDGRLVEGMSGMTFSRVSRKLQDRARDFECSNGRIEYSYSIDGGEGPPFSIRIQIGRASDGALLVNVRQIRNLAPFLFGWFSSWHRYEFFPIAQTDPHAPEAPL